MIIALMVFLVVAGAVTGGFFFVTSRLPEARKRRELELRLQEVSRPEDVPDQSVVVRQHKGPLPSVEKLIGRHEGGVGSQPAHRAVWGQHDAQRDSAREPDLRRICRVGGVRFPQDSRCAVRMRPTRSLAPGAVAAPATIQQDEGIRGTVP